MRLKRLLLLSTVAVMFPVAAVAITLPGGADVSRLRPFATGESGKPELKPLPAITVPESAAAPAEAATIHFTLHQVLLQGNTVLSAEALSAIYQPYIGKEVTLDVAWAFAEQITEHYRKAGYFLSRAYVPAQEIAQGTLRIAIAEGEIHSVTLEGKGADLSVVKAWAARIRQSNPAKIQAVEEALLELNSLGGLSWRAVLEPDTTARGPAARLRLISTDKPATGILRLDNQGSRYLGPYQAGGSYTMSLLPEHTTTLTGLTALPTRELQNFAIMHSVALAPRWSMDARASYARAEPGYTLTVQEIESKNIHLGVGGSYQWLRQRNESLSSRLGFDWVRSVSDVLQSPLTRDDIRVLRGSTAYAVADRWGGQNHINTTLSQGVSWFEASKEGQSYRSRAQADSDFTKLEVQASRLQPLGHGFDLQLSLVGQLASGPLYASEEFGYGGGDIGRAYDNSELVGDDGISALAEMRYAGIDFSSTVTPVPYLFYDFGAVWNDDTAQAVRQTGSSAGVGSYFNTSLGMGGNISLAWPLGHAPSAPIYGHNGSAPRLRVETTYRF